MRRQFSGDFRATEGVTSGVTPRYLAQDKQWKTWQFREDGLLPRQYFC